MTGKRFEYKNHKVFDNLTGEEHSSNMVSVNVLNQLARVNREGVKKVQKLAKENEQLKFQLDECRNHKLFSRRQLEEENERLKKERNHFERKKTEYLTEWNKSRIQNTELKKDNQELKEAMKRMMIEMMGG